MTRYIVIAGEAAGHNAPLQRLSRLLAKEKQENFVALFGPSWLEPEVREVDAFYDYLADAIGVSNMLEAARKVSLDLGCDLPSEIVNLKDSTILFAVYLIFYTPILQKISELKPDAIVGDSGYVWSFFIAKLLKLPFISSCSSALQPPENAEFGLRDLEYNQRALTKLNKELGITYDAADRNRNYSDFTIAWTLKELDHSGMSNTKFFGSTMQLEELHKPLTDSLAKEVEQFQGQTLYISMGTVVGQKPWPVTLDSFFATIFDTFAGNEDLLVILSIGKNFDASKLPSPTPANFRVERKVNQREILRVVDGFISHGGNNSVHESLFLGTPLLVVPVIGDQHENAEAVTAASLGLQIESPFSPGATLNFDHVTRNVLSEKVEQLLSSVEIKTKCRALQNEFEERAVYVEKHGASDIKKYVEYKQHKQKPDTTKQIP